MNAPYNPIDIANYIVWRAVKAGKPITQLKLQKLLYYVAAKYLKMNGKPLFSEPIQKWQFGPVVKSVYHHFKLHGNRTIDEPVAYLTSSDIFNIQFADVMQISQTLDSVAPIKVVVSTVLDELLAKDAFALVARTHKEPAYRDFEAQILQGEDLQYAYDELEAANI